MRFMLLESWNDIEQSYKKQKSIECIMTYIYVIIVSYSLSA